MLIILRYLGGPFHHQISVLLHIEHLLYVIVEHSNLILFVLQLFQIFEELAHLRGFTFIHQGLEPIQIYQRTVGLIDLTGINAEFDEIEKRFNIFG